METTKLTGLIAAPHTPMDQNGDLALGIIERQAERLARWGVVGAFVCGTTGEGLSLSTDERLRVAKRWTAVAGADLKVIVHVGHCSGADAAALASGAAQAGAHAVAAMAPPFFKPATVADLIDFLVPIAAAAGELPFYYYHIPSMTGVNLSMTRLLEEGSRRIPNLRGIKYTHNNLMEYQQCVALDGGRHDILFGQDEILLAALATGAQGAVGSTYNYAAPLYYRLIRAFREGNLIEARRCAAKVVAMIDLVIAFGPLPAGKAIMSLVGVECGPTRPPVANLTAARREELLRKIGELNVVGEAGGATSPA